MVTSATPTPIKFGPAPKYVATFKKSHRMHVRGHIWLANETVPPLEITFTLSHGFKFNSSGKGPMFLGTDANNLKVFDPCGGVFSGPILASDTELSFSILIFDSKKYFYLLNIIAPGNKPFSVDDPIIVNK